MERVELTHEMLAAKQLRFANYLIDFVVQYGLGYAIGAISGLLYVYLNVDGPYTWLTNMNRLEELLLGYAIGLFYYFTFEALTQRSLGKYITGTKVITFEGDKPSAGTILKRSFCRMIPFNVLSFLGEPGKGWHDTLSDTYVVNVKKYEEALRLKNSFEEIGTQQE